MGSVARCIAFMAALTATSCAANYFACKSNAQCESTPGAECESTGFCSVPDSTCESGHRYGQYAAGNISGQCVVVAATPDLAQIDASAPDASLRDASAAGDLCVGSQNDPNNCGGCNVVCAAGEYCVHGACSCPTAIPELCTSDLGTYCTNTLTDVENCGACGLVCSAGQLCQAGGCVANCSTSPILYTSCGTYCADLQNEPEHCGACNSACSEQNITAVCVSGTCNGNCTAGHADCNGDKQADGCEVNTQSDTNNCGLCGTVCSNNHITPACDSGRCDGQCASGFADCNGDVQSDGCETATNTDELNCGSCNNDCTQQGLTSPDCISGSCVDLYSDSNNCGTQGHSCLPGTCVAGVCENLALFGFSGAAQTFVVPTGVTSLIAKVWGGAGGACADFPNPGGGGGFAEATLVVTPGETLYLNVGGGGASAPNGCGMLHTGGGAGGYNGGGDGDLGAGGGGGHSDVSRVTMSGTSFLLIAAGGGAYSADFGSSGGGGGGTTGGDGGYNSAAPVSPNVSGVGGTQACGGSMMSGGNGTNEGGGGGGGYCGGTGGSYEGGGGGSSYLSGTSALTLAGDSGGNAGGNGDADYGSASAGAGDPNGSDGHPGQIFLSW